MDKRTFKICEAVALGLDCYYMSARDRHKITKADKMYANLVIPTLEPGWMIEKHKWDLHK